jgi:hypothetical protein
MQTTCVGVFHILLHNLRLSEGLLLLLLWLLLLLLLLLWLLLLWLLLLKELRLQETGA